MVRKKVLFSRYIVTRVFTWHPPISWGWVKCNIDGVEKGSPGLVWCRGVFRNHYVHVGMFNIGTSNMLFLLNYWQLPRPLRVGEIVVRMWFNVGSASFQRWAYCSFGDKEPVENYAVHFTKYFNFIIGYIYRLKNTCLMILC